MIVYFPSLSERITLVLSTASSFEVQVFLSAHSCLLRDIVSRSLAKHVPSFEISYREVYFFFHDNSADFGRVGVTLDEVSPGHRSLTLKFRPEKSSYTLGRGLHELFSGNFISTHHANLKFKDQSVRSHISIKNLSYLSSLLLRL